MSCVAKGKCCFILSSDIFLSQKRKCSFQEKIFVSQKVNVAQYFQEIYLLNGKWSSRVKQRALLSDDMSNKELFNILFPQGQLIWVGPWEKVSQNIDPFKNHFFLTNYQHWTGTSASQPFLTPPYPWGGLGGPGGVWGGSADPKIAIFVRRPISALECNVLG